MYPSKWGFISEALNTTMWSSLSFAKKINTKLNLLRDEQINMSAEKIASLGNDGEPANLISWFVLGTVERQPMFGSCCCCCCKMQVKTRFPRSSTKSAFAQRQLLRFRGEKNEVQ